MNCECLSYCVAEYEHSIVIQATGHHPNCPKNIMGRDNTIRELASTLRDLIRGVFDWAAEEDGIPCVLSNGGVDIFATVKKGTELLCMVDDYQKLVEAEEGEKRE